MKKLIALCTIIACTGALAADPARQQIEAHYKAEKAQCHKNETGKGRKACEKEARGHRDVALTELKAHPDKGDWIKTDRERQKAIGASTDARYSAEKERCKEMSGDAKDRCIADAKKKYSKG